MTAVVTTLRIVCPDWCQVTQRDHVQRLPEQAGIPLHEGVILLAPGADRGWDLPLRIVGSSYADGSEYPQDPFCVAVDGVYLSAEGAMVLAQALMVAARRLDPTLPTLDERSSA